MRGFLALDRFLCAALEFLSEVFVEALDRGEFLEFHVSHFFELDEALGRWLTNMEIDGILVRRDEILERASTLTERLDPESVLYP